MAVKILHKRSAVEFKSATGAQLELGELALNYNESGPYLQCKDAAGEIAQLGGVYIGASAPGNELKGAWWLRDTDSTLFLYDGTRWVSIAGGGGGGGTGDITEVIGGDGIKATELVGVVTVEVDLAADSHGLSIVGGKLQADIATTSSLGTVKIGDGIDVDASGEISVDLSGVDVNADLEYVPDGNNNAEITNTAGDDATVPIAIQADSDATPTPTAGVAGLFTGLEKEKLAGIEAGAQVNGVPVTISDTAPVDPADGDLWWNSSNNSGRLYVYYKDANSSQWVESSPQGDTLTESDADVLYLSKVSDDTAAGEITFEKVTTHEVGIKTNKASSLNGSNALFISQDDAVAFQFDSTSVVDGAGTSSGALFSFSTTDLFQKPTNGVSSYIEDGAKNVDAISCFNANLGTSVASDNYIAGFRSSVNNGANTSGAGTEYNFYAVGNAPNFFTGDTHIGGSPARNTFELYKSTLTEEQLEQLEAGTLVAPANVSLPGDGSFARQWWYDQQSAEDQALIDSGELDYPTHLAAATFTDTFALGDNTKINLLSNGNGQFGNNIQEDNLNTGVEIVGAGIVTARRAANSNVWVGYETGKSAGTSFIKGDGRVGLGGEPSLNSTFHLTGTHNGGAGNGIGIRTDATLTTGTGSGLVIGVDSRVATTDNAELTQFAAFGTQTTAVTKQSGFVADNTLISSLTNQATAVKGFESRLNTNNNRTNTYNFYAAGNAPNYFKGDFTCDGLINGAFSLRMQSDDPAAYTTTLTTDEEGNEVSNSVYQGTTEDLLSIIKDLRTRIAALEGA